MHVAFLFSLWNAVWSLSVLIPSDAFHEYRDGAWEVMGEGKRKHLNHMRSCDTHTHQPALSPVNHLMCVCVCGFVACTDWKCALEMEERVPSDYRVLELTVLGHRFQITLL